MTLQSILQTKGSDVYTIAPSATLQDAVQLLNDHNCGSLVVTEEQDSKRVLAIITERDILHACGAGKVPLDQYEVRTVMSNNVITGNSETPVSEAMRLMTENRIRHLPIVKDDQLVGMISIGDVVKFQYHQLSAENYHLKNYIQS